MRSWPAGDVPRLPDGPRTEVRVHDSSRRELTPVPGRDGVARMYVCGITPYDATHLGHAATYLAFDTLNRVWRDAGLTVRYAQNVTDIDDPLLERAARDGQDWTELAERETELFREDMTALRVLPPDDYVGAVEAMDDIAARVLALQEAGLTYEVDGDVYFAVAGAPAFGEVSGLDREQMTALFAERGGDPARPGKKDPLDALLWLAARPGEPAWDSPLGRGRPGWHVECAAIALDRLGSTVDVQGGGSDLLFPHHEHSAVEAEALSGVRPFAQAYVHAGMVGLEGEKMSKSRGNLVFVSRLRRAGVEPAALRLALLSAHYRADREWTDATLEQGQARLAAWTAGVARPTGPDGAGLLSGVRAALAQDLDTPRALELVDEWAGTAGDDAGAPALVRDVLDALLGVAVP
ncbi:MAG: cysteine--1-D-myo-inosityl 2-amino-2-deoxy-alpha-D-glucopyranoside ligase [Actinobacteria bacterium]|nr:cysteine--1-D-myo-inosityl 2-amino-2-deoxy-alpha-D-glucopyranoside ligase [Actinomycetota bacterium]MCA1721426.1 cysteine--1-D-myo-inosityl 2-amino-2-deoxy-alpha-D-glucopyranoside ligase [Actinomycetota bacterium]